MIIHSGVVYVSLAIHGGCAAPSNAASAIYGRRTTRKHPFQLQKKFRRGESKNAKGFSGGVQRAHLPARRRGLASSIFLEMGSSFVVKLHQNLTKVGIVAHSGDFFFGFAEQNPDVFRGGRNFWGSLRLRLFVF